MSVHVISWVLKHSEATKSRRLVLIALADKANEDGTGAYPSIETIRQEARLDSKSTVYEALAELEDTGQIRRNGKGPNGVTRWQIVMGNEGAFYRRVGSSEVLGDGGPEIGKSRKSGPKPSLGTVQGQRDRSDGSIDGSGPEIGGLPDGAWDRIRARLDEALSEFNFYVYVEPLEPLGLRDGTALVFRAPAHIATTVAARFAAKITAAARAELGPTVTVEVRAAGTSLEEAV